ncbi:MAG: hypothetical protein U0326_26100 [Polyangiales bacterium]
MGHTTPQPPQLFGSLAVNTQKPPHDSCPVGHEVTHVPAVQT